MKAELSDCNFQNLLNRLYKGSTQQKAVSLKKFNFLYDNARSRVYLYERRITQSLELLLLMEESDIANLTLSLLEKIIVNVTAESEIFIIIKKRLLSKIVLNLGSVDITTRKISHRCILEYIRKFKDYDSIVTNYIKTAIEQTENVHLKLKSINSFRTLIDAEPRSFQHGVLNTRVLMEELIYASYQKEQIEIRKAALLCLIEILRLDNSEKTLKMICPNAQKQLSDLRLENPELANLIDLILKYKNSSNKESESDIDSAPSPKFMSICEEPTKDKLCELERLQKSPTAIQLKILNDLSFAEQFLKKLEQGSNWQLNEIRQFAPHLEKYLIDENIKLFSISKKIVEVIFDSESEEQKEFYVILVPCVVNGISNKRFIVRRHLDKLIRQYIKNHTDVWVYNFMERFAMATNPRDKEILMDLFMHAYRTCPEFYHPYQRTFKIMENEIKDTNSNLKWRAVDCLITVLEKHGKNEKVQEDMMSKLTSEVYNKVVRKMHKTHNSIGSHSGSAEPLSPAQKARVRAEKKLRLITDQPMGIQRPRQKHRIENISEQKMVPSSVHREKRVRKSQADIEFNFRKVRQIRQKEKEDRQDRDTHKQDKNSIKKLPQLKRTNNLPSINTNLRRPEIFLNESPVKKSMGEKNIMYIDKENLSEMTDPKLQLEKALMMIKDNSWNTQFDSINCIRSVTEYHKQLISDEYYNLIISELLQCLNNHRSGVNKIALICLGELMRKFHKKSYMFTEQILNTLIRKSITTSEFIHEQIKRCIAISAEELCPNKIILSLNSLKSHAKGSDIKISILGMVDAICQKNQKLYKKETEWVWNNLIQFHEDHSSHVKNEARRVARGVIEHYPNWKNDISTFKTYTLERIDKILKGINANNPNSPEEVSWLQKENSEFSRLISAKIITPRYFVNEYSKIEEQDRQYALKKNFKERIKLLGQIFACAFEHRREFEQNSNVKKYILLAVEHLDEKNPGLLINSLSILTKCLEVFPSLLESDEHIILAILSRTLQANETKRVEMRQCIANFLRNFFDTIDSGKCCKELLKLFYICLAYQNSGVSPGLFASSNGISLNVLSSWLNFANSNSNSYTIVLNTIINLLNLYKDQSVNRSSQIDNEDDENMGRKIKLRTELYEEEQKESKPRTGKFECVEALVVKILQKLPQENSLNQPSIMPKFKEILDLLSGILGHECTERITKNSEQIYSSNREGFPKKTSGTKDLHHPDKKDKSQSIERARNHRKKVISGPRLSPQKSQEDKTIPN